MSSDPINPVPYEPEYPGVPPQKTPPATVTFAAWSQFAILALAVVSTIIAIVSTLDLTDQMRESLARSGAVAQSDIDTFVGIVQVFAIGLSIVMLMFAVAIGVLGFFNLRGRNGARITTWVLAGFGLACGICSGISTPFSSTDVAVSGQGGDELTRAMNQAVAEVQIPAWMNVTSILTLVVSTLLYLAVIILLALPASNDYFRKEPPPVPGFPPSHFG